MTGAPTSIEDGRSGGMTRTRGWDLQTNSDTLFDGSWQALEVRRRHAACRSLQRRAVVNCKGVLLLANNPHKTYVERSWLCNCQAERCFCREHLLVLLQSAFAKVSPAFHTLYDPCFVRVLAPSS